MLSRTLLLLATLGLVHGCGGGGEEGPQTADSGFGAGDFHRIASDGFDDRFNSYPWAMELFDGDGDGTPEVYVGTWGNGTCVQSWTLPEAPPERWLCPNPLFDPGNQGAYLQASRKPAHVYRGRYEAASDTWAWERVWSPSLDDVEGFRGAAVFQGALYMLGGLSKGYVWKSTDGENWEKASPEWMTAYGGFRGARVYRGKLYIASDVLGALFCSEDPSTDPGSWTWGNSLGFVDSGGETRERELFGGPIASATPESLTSPWIPPLPPLAGTGLFEVRILTGAGAGQVRQAQWNEFQKVYVVHDGQGQPFDPVPQPGDTFRIVAPDMPRSGASWQLAEFAGHLYAGAQSGEGTELWRSEDGTPGSWTRVIEGGYFNPGPAVFVILEPFGDYLYLGTATFPQFVAPGDEIQACEILRVDALGNVELLVGSNRPNGTPGTDHNRPLSLLGPGFDNQVNIYAWYAEVHDGWLYVGTNDGSGKIRDATAEGLEGDILGSFFQFLTLDRSGFDLFRTQDGITWHRVTNGGFGERDNFGVRNLLSSPWGLLLGAANSVDGLQIWLGR